MMGTRLESGINKAEFLKVTGYNIRDILDNETADQYASLGLIIENDKALKLTDKGLMPHNYLVPRLLEKF